MPDLDKPVPICSPIGVIAISAPRLNSAIPTMSNSALQMKTMLSVSVKETSGVKFRIITIAVTGKTDTVDSDSFFSKAFSIATP